MVGIFLIVAVTIIVLTSYRDSQMPVKYNCELLIGSWHPDFPPDAIEACRKKGIMYDNSKTNYR
jgi:hypothetical protein